MTTNQRKAPDGGEPMQALSVRQPGANALVTGVGPSELPGWLTGYRGPLLIHARRREGGDPPVLPGVAYGALIGVVEMVDCLHRGHVDGGPDEAVFVWVLANPRTFASPIRYAGRAGIFSVAASVVVEALAALGILGQHPRPTGGGGEKRLAAGRSGGAAGAQPGREKGG